MNLQPRWQKNCKQTVNWLFPHFASLVSVVTAKKQRKDQKNAFGEVITEKVIYFYQLSQFISPFWEHHPLATTIGQKEMLNNSKEFQSRAVGGRMDVRWPLRVLSKRQPLAERPKNEKDLSCLRYTLRDKGRRISISLFQSKFLWNVIAPTQNMPGPGIM